MMPTSTTSATLSATLRLVDQTSRARELQLPRARCAGAINRSDVSMRTLETLKMRLPQDFYKATLTTLFPECA